MKRFIAEQEQALNVTIMTISLLLTAFLYEEYGSEGIELESGIRTPSLRMKFLVKSSQFVTLNTFEYRFSSALRLKSSTV